MPDQRHQVLADDLFCRGSHTSPAVEGMLVVGGKKARPGNVLPPLRSQFIAAPGKLLASERRVKQKTVVFPVPHDHILLPSLIDFYFAKIDLVGHRYCGLRVRDTSPNFVNEDAPVTLSFPNSSRSYDAVRRRVRFWGSALEISFFIEASALCKLAPRARHDEAGFLAAFDNRRDEIQQAAMRVYTRHGSAAYSLRAADF